jgi:hypothetical protein
MLPEVAVLIVVVAALALGFGFGLRSQIARASRVNASDLERLSQTLTDMRNDIDELRRELGEVKAATEVVPIPPPLPRARPGRLDDLREQLRASHREPEPTPDD